MRASFFLGFRWRSLRPQATATSPSRTFYRKQRTLAALLPGKRMPCLASVNKRPRGQVPSGSRGFQDLEPRIWCLPQSCAGLELFHHALTGGAHNGLPPHRPGRICLRTRFRPDFLAFFIRKSDAWTKFSSIFQPKCTRFAKILSDLVNPQMAGGGGGV